MIARGNRRQFRMKSYPPPATISTAAGGKMMLMQVTTMR